MFMILWREAKQTGEDVCLQKWLNKSTKKQRVSHWNDAVKTKP